MSQHEIKREAIRLLARREYSSLELAKKLAEKSFTEQDIKVVLAELKDKGLQCNKRFAESFLHSRILQGFGPVKIEAELAERGIDPETIEDVFLAIPMAWESQVKLVYGKRYREPPKNDKEKQQRVRFLMGRGFNEEDIRKVVPEIAVAIE